MRPGGVALRLRPGHRGLDWSSQSHTSLCTPCPDETPANKRLARNLVEKWSRPILVSRQHRSMDSYEEQQILAARQSRLAAAAPRVSGLVPGRWRRRQSRCHGGFGAPHSRPLSDWVCVAHLPTSATRRLRTTWIPWDDRWLSSLVNQDSGGMLPFQRQRPWTM